MTQKQRTELLELYKQHADSMLLDMLSSRRACVLGSLKRMARPTRYFGASKNLETVWVCKVSTEADMPKANLKGAFAPSVKSFRERVPFLEMCRSADIAARLSAISSPSACHAAISTGKPRQEHRPLPSEVLMGMCRWYG